MTKEILQQKLAGLEAQMQQLQANANALQGAIQFCKQLLTEIEASDLNAPE